MSYIDAPSLIESSDQSSLEEDRQCDAFKCVISDTDDTTPTWIGCNCNRWFHLYCVNLDELDDNFSCDFCNY